MLLNKETKPHTYIYMYIYIWNSKAQKNLFITITSNSPPLPPKMGVNSFGDHWKELKKTMKGKIEMKSNKIYKQNLILIKNKNRCFTVQFVKQKAMKAKAEQDRKEFNKFWTNLFSKISI